MNEIWKDIYGYEGRYQISNLGRVKGLCYHNGTKERILKLRKNQSGYIIVNLYKAGSNKGNLRTVHRLVAEHFLSNDKKYPMINHKDENIENNNVENLEWCDNRYNVLYSIKLHPERYKEKSAETKRRYSKQTNPIVQKTLEGKKINIYINVRQVVKETGFHQWSIIECCKGKRKKAYGYKWEFA